MTKKQYLLKAAYLLSIVLSVVTVTETNAAVIDHIENVNSNDIFVVQSALSPDGNYYYDIKLADNKHTIHVFRRDKNNGKLTEIQTFGGNDFFQGEVVDFSVYSISVSPDSKQLYVGAGFGAISKNPIPHENSIIKFNIGTNGQISYDNRLIIEDVPYDLKITNTGKFIFSGSLQINVISRASNGNLALRSSIKKDANDNILLTPGNYAIGPNSKTLYASSSLGHGHLYTFTLNDGTGILTNTQTFVGKGHDFSYTGHIGEIEINGQGGEGSLVTNDGRFFYSVGGARTSNPGYGAISIFTRATDGKLTFLNNVKSPSDPETGDVQNILFSSNQDISISPDQRFIYVSDRIKENIGVWRRNESSGDLSFVGLVENDKEPINLGDIYNLTISADGRHIYASGEGIVVFDLRADLSLVKTDATDPVNTSGTIDYTLAVTNETGADAQNVVITDTLPAGTSFVSGSVNSNTGSCSANGQKVTCTMGKVLSGDAYNAVIKVKAPATEGQITNTATVTSDQLDKNSANNTDTETTNISSGGTPTTPPTDDGSGGGGSMPLEFLLLLIPLFLRRIRMH